jgi:hypothetical protein
MTSYYPRTNRYNGGQVRSFRNYSGRPRNAWRNDPMTDTQAAKIRKEIARRVLHEEPRVNAELLSGYEAFANGSTINDRTPTKGNASDLIDWLLTRPYASASQRAAQSDRYQPEQNEPVREPGIYRYTDGSVYRVVESKRNPGRFVAKMVTGHGWEYAKGMVYRLTSDMKMTAEQIAQFGIDTEVCAQCSTRLEDPRSKKVGLGTKCGPEILGKETYRAAYKNAEKDPQVAEQLAAIKAGKQAAKAEIENEVAAYIEIGSEPPASASQAVQDLYFKTLMAQREADQERAAEQAKADWKNSVERF